MIREIYTLYYGKNTKFLGGYILLKNFGKIMWNFAR